MNNQCVLFFNLVLILNCQFGHLLHETETKVNENQKNKLNVKIYYESLCYDSMVFFRQQLYPTWLKRKDFMSLSLIPYGKAIVSI